MDLSERMEPMFPNKVEKEANTDTTDSDWGIREIIPGAPAPEHVCTYMCAGVHMHMEF